MIDEILCAFSVRCFALVSPAAVAVALLHGCCGASSARSEADLNASVRRVQQHEAAIEVCACAAVARQHATAICDEANTSADPDLRARCHQALHRVEAIPTVDAECDCE